MSDVLDELEWLSATKLVLYHRICNVRTIVQTGQPSAIACKLESATDHGHDTRNTQRLRLPRIHTEAGRRQLLYSGVDSYNVFNTVYDGRVSEQSDFTCSKLKREKGDSITLLCDYEYVV